MRQGIYIVFLCILAAVCYGILHDQITARVCVEYFTLGHPPIFNTNNPTLLGLGWGIIATWWVGLIIGLPLALVAQRGPQPPRSARSIIRPLLILLSVMGGCALVAGVSGWFLAQNGSVFLVGDLGEQIPRDKHIAFLADLWAHSASYLAGLVGGIVLIVSVWRSRNRMARETPA